MALGNDNPIESWGNQAIRLPRHMELNAEQALIEKHGEVLTIRPRRRSWLDPAFPADVDDVDVESPPMGPIREPGSSACLHARHQRLNPCDDGSGGGREADSA